MRYHHPPKKKTERSSIKENLKYSISTTTTSTEYLMKKYHPLIISIVKKIETFFKKFNHILKSAT